MHGHEAKHHRSLEDAMKRGVNALTSVPERKDHYSIGFSLSVSLE